MSDSADILCEIEDSIAQLTIHHPRRANALTMGMIRALDAALDRIESSRARLVRIRGTGERFFCAGADISEWGNLSPDNMGRVWIREGNRVFARLAQLDAVVIAQINGDVYGGGLEIALCADLRYAGESVKLGFPEVGIGAIPGWMGCTRLQNLIGPGRAKQMILSGESVDAVTAERWGLLNAVCPSHELDRHVTAVMQALRAKSAVAISAAKRVMHSSLDAERFAALHELAASAVKASGDAAEGVAAFLAKRKPVFTG